MSETRRRLAESLASLEPDLERALAEMREEEARLEQEVRDAEIAPHSWDLSAQKGAEMRLDEHRERLEALEELARAAREARVALEEP